MNKDSLLIAIGIVLALVLSGYALAMSMRADGRIDYCRIRYDNNSPIHPPTYIIEGHRPWRQDVVVGVAPTLEEANKKRDELCVDK